METVLKQMITMHVLAVKVFLFVCLFGKAPEQLAHSGMARPGA